MRPAIAATVSSSSADSCSPSVCRRQRQVARVDVAQHLVDQLRVRPVVLVDLEARARRSSTSASRWPSSIARAPACMPTLSGQRLEPGEHPLHRERRLLEARRDQRRDAGRRARAAAARGRSCGRGVSTAPGRGDQPVRHVRLRVGADDEVDAVADRRAPGPADAGDPAVLDADVGLDDADDGVDDERAGEHDVELRRARSPRSHWAIRRAEVLRVAPDRLVAAGGAVLADPDPQVRVAEADAVAGRRRRTAPGTPRRRGGSSSRLPSSAAVSPRRPRPRSGPGARSSSRPAPSPRSAPAGEVEVEARGRPRGRTRGAALTRWNG